jgi:FtsH-binding integral membrane protein
MILGLADTQAPILMTRYGQLVLIVMVVVITAAVLWLMARRRLTMGFGLFWLVGFAGLAALVASKSLLIFIAGLLGTLYPDAAIRVLAFVVLLCVQIYFSVRLSQQENRLAEMGQAVALLEHELRQAQSSARTADIDGHGPGQDGPGQDGPAPTAE